MLIFQYTMPKGISILMLLSCYPPFPNCTYDFCCFQPRFDLDKCFQVLIKKDMEDQNDATMSEFLDRLVTAYRDPALMPLQYSADIDSLNRPLISSAGV
jgi:hypothetical protein